MEATYMKNENAYWLTHWGRVTHMCVGKLIIIGSDNGLSPGRRQAIIWTNAGILLIGPLAANFSEILIAIETFSFKKMHLKMLCGKCRPFCLGLSVLSLHLYFAITNYVIRRAYYKMLKSVIKSNIFVKVYLLCISSSLFLAQIA